MRKVIYVVLFTLAALVLLPALLVSLLLFTRPGADWVLSELADRELIAYSELSGSIADGLHLKSLVIYLPGREFSLENLQLQTALSPLLRGELKVSKLVAETVAIVVHSPEQQQARDVPAFLTANRPLLPFSLSLAGVAVNSLSVTDGENVHHFREIQLAAGIGQTGIEAITLSLDYLAEQLQVGLRLKGHLYTWPRLRGELSLDWSANKDGEKTDGHGDISVRHDRVGLKHRTSGAVISALEAELSNWRVEPELLSSGEIEYLKLPEAWSGSLNATRFELSGGFANLQGVIQGEVSREGWQPIPFRLSAQLLGQRLLIEPLQVEMEAGGVSFNGWLDWSDAHARWQGRLLSDRFAADYFHDMLPEIVSGELTVAGDWQQQLSLQLETEKLYGELRGNAFDLSLQGRVEGPEIEIENLVVGLGENRFTARGLWGGETLNLIYDIDAPRLDEVYSRLSGSLVSSGRISGQLSQPSVAASARAEAFSYARFGADRLELDLSLSAGVFNAAANRMLAVMPVYGSMALSELELKASGEWLSPQLEFLARTEEGSAALVVNAEVSDDSLSGQLRQLAFSPDDGARWLLQQPVDWSYAGDRWQLSSFCLHSAGRRFCAGGEGSRETVSLSVNTVAMPLGWVQTLASSPVILQGGADIDAALIVGEQGVTGGVRLSSAANGPMTLSVREDPKRRLEVSSLVSDWSFYGQRAEGSLSAKIEDQANIDGQLVVERIMAADSPVSGQVVFEFPDLSAYASLIPGVELESGQLRGTVTVTNTLDQPRLRTSAELSVPRLFLHPLGVDWRDLEVAVDSSGDNVARISASVIAGEGELAVTGDVKANSFADWSARLQLSGKNALLFDLPGRRIVANPDLLLAATPAAIDIRGRLLIPEAEIAIDSKPDRLKLTPDAIIHGGEPPAKQAGPAITLDTELVLGSDVHFQAYGFNTLLGGTLQLERSPKGNLLAYGDLNLTDGAYTAYGQDLSIDKGKLGFTGLLNQPWVDIFSTRKVGSVSAGIHLTGQIDNLRSRLYSTPAMTDSEILSYIITGKPLDHAGRSDQNMIANAALSFAVSQSPLVTSKIAAATGLDNVEVSAEDGVETLGLILGKYLTPDLYIRYGYGVVDKLNKLFVEYQLTDRLFLETEVGAGQSVDLIYRSQ